MVASAVGSSLHPRLSFTQEAAAEAAAEEAAAAATRRQQQQQAQQQDESFRNNHDDDMSSSVVSPPPPLPPVPDQLIRLSRPEQSSSSVTSSSLQRTTTSSGTQPWKRFQNNNNNSSNNSSSHNHHNNNHHNNNNGSFLQNDNFSGHSSFSGGYGSDDDNNNDLYSQEGEEQEDDGSLIPQDLVKRKNRILCSLKVLLWFIVLGAGGSTAYYSYVSSRQQHQTHLTETYQQDATRIIQHYYQSQIRIWQNTMDVSQQISLYASSSSSQQALLLQQQQQQVQTQQQQQMQEPQLSQQPGPPPPLQQQQQQQQQANQTQQNQTQQQQTTTWPFVTIPNFDTETRSISRQRGVEWIGFGPILQTQAERDEWEQYVVVTTATATINSTNSTMNNNNNTETWTTLQDGLFALYSNNETNPPRILRQPDRGPAPFCPLYQVCSKKTTTTFPNHLRLWNLYSIDYLQDILGRVAVNGLSQATPFLQTRENVFSSSSSSSSSSSWPEEVNGTVLHSFFIVPILREYQPQPQQQQDNSTSTTTTTTVGFLVVTVNWESILSVPPTTTTTTTTTSSLRQRDRPPMDIVLYNTCQPSEQHSYRTHDGRVVYLGRGDYHKTDNDAYRVSSQPTELNRLFGETIFVDNGNNNNNNNNNLYSIKDMECVYSIDVYPHEDWTSPRSSLWFLLVLLALFGFMLAVFFVYDVLVEQRQRIVMDSAVRSNAIVRSLFPAVVRSRLFGRTHHHQPHHHHHHHYNQSSFHHSLPSTRRQSSSSGLAISRRNSGFLGSQHQQQSSSTILEGEDTPFFQDEAVIPNRMMTPKIRLTRFLKNNNNNSHHHQQPQNHNQHHHHHQRGNFANLSMPSPYGIAGGEDPIAEMFPRTTIMFADIAGFTAWSSEREPTQVFKLLETLYHAFDLSARRLGVFKVETIGDCYVAVTGLPDPIDNHATIMAKFAYECLHQMKNLTKELEVTLGPGTSELALRIGLHSGAVTAGVLRGEKSRFQLFGDTMNTASRMESTGIPNRIQISQATADLLSAAGKSYWLTPRDEMVHAKGKGKMQTYWLKFRRASNISLVSVETAVKDTLVNALPEDEHNEDSTTVSQTKSVGLWGRLNMIEGSICSSRGSQSKSSTSPRTETGGQQAPTPHTSGIKLERLIGWNVKVLLSLLQEVVRHRVENQGIQWVRPTPEQKRESPVILDEVSEIIRLPPFSSSNLDNSSHHDRSVGGGSSVGGFRKGSENHSHGGSSGGGYQSGSSGGSRRRQTAPHVSLAPEVRVQLRRYVSAIANLYRDVPFHNFEHASHVTMSANKLMKRIMTPDSVSDNNNHNHKVGSRNRGSSSSNNNTGRESRRQRRKNYASALHHSTFGISSDPLTRFAVVFAALIHDVGHTGVANAQLVKEGQQIAKRFHNKSVAEQNSVVVAWDLLMEARFADLQTSIFGNEDGRRRFRQLVVNAVMATDILDTELLALRKNRWDKAFHVPSRRSSNESQKDEESIGCSKRRDEIRKLEEEEAMNRKATIVIEHIIQASDVAHTMQHWHIFVRWNKRLFDEMYGAYQDNRSEEDPTEGWYEAQLAFFDNYVIPLARKLKECGVFGVSSDEYLTYALENRKEWEMKGQQVSREMISDTGDDNNPFRVVNAHHDALEPDDTFEPPDNDNFE